VQQVVRLVRVVLETMEIVRDIMDLSIKTSIQILELQDCIRARREIINTAWGFASNALDNNLPIKIPGFIGVGLLNIVRMLASSTQNPIITDEITVIIGDNNDKTSIELDEYLSIIFGLLIMEDEIPHQGWCSIEDKKRIHNLIFMYDSGVISYLYNVIFSKLDAPSASMSWVSGFFISCVALEGIINICVLKNTSDKTKTIEQLVERKLSKRYQISDEYRRFENFIKSEKPSIGVLKDISTFRDDYAHGRLKAFEDYKSYSNISIMKQIRWVIISALNYEPMP
jgi:hypothetical protein